MPTQTQLDLFDDAKPMAHVIEQPLAGVRLPGDRTPYRFPVGCIYGPDACMPVREDQQWVVPAWAVWAHRYELKTFTPVEVWRAGLGLHIAQLGTLQPGAYVFWFQVRKMRVIRAKVARHELWGVRVLVPGHLQPLIGREWLFPDLSDSTNNHFNEVLKGGPHVSR